MADRDYVELLGPCGNARKFFKEAAQGAEWVDKVCSDIVSELLTARELADNVSSFLDDPRCITFSLHKAKGEYHVSIAIDKIQNYHFTKAATIPLAIEAAKHLFEQKSK